MYNERRKDKKRKRDGRREGGKGGREGRERERIGGYESVVSRTCVWSGG